MTMVALVLLTSTMLTEELIVWFPSIIIIGSLVLSAEKITLALILLMCTAIVEWVMFDEIVVTFKSIDTKIKASVTEDAT